LFLSCILLCVAVADHRHAPATTLSFPSQEAMFLAKFDRITFFFSGARVDFEVKTENPTKLFGKILGTWFKL
ncbi:hypothetical protein SDJN02_11850, partial [Cucurbita argyrosperma subsp. argyrosperma]